MDLENDIKSTEINKYINTDDKNITYKVSYAIVKKVNPFNTVGNYHEKRLQDRLNRSNYSRTNNTNEDNITFLKSTSTNNTLNFQEEDVFQRQPCLQRNDTTDSKRSDSVLSLRTESSDISCYRNISNMSNNGQTTHKNPCQCNRPKSFARNVIFTKPVVTNENRDYERNADRHMTQDNMYNEDIVSKTTQKQARLRTIVKNLVTQRQKEKQRETWNNYINELKNKHRYYSNEPIRISPQYVPIDSNRSEVFDNYWDSRYSWHQSDSSKNLLSTSNETCRKDKPTRYCNKIYLEPEQYYVRNPCFYPISSYARFMVLDRAREQSSSHSQRPKKHCTDNCYRRRQFRDRSCGPRQKSFSNLQSQGVSTEIFNQETKTNSISKTISTKKIPETDDKRTTLEEIEKKLDILSESFNLAMAELRDQMVTNVKKYPITLSQSESCNVRSLSDLKSLKKESDLQNSSQVLLKTNPHDSDRNSAPTEIGTSTDEPKECRGTVIDDIIEEEMKKSEELKQEIKTLLYTTYYRRCSTAIQFDIPTKDISTVITNSKIRYCPEQEVQVGIVNSLIKFQDKGCNRQSAIAVNTEPLGLLGLLQVSSGTIKQLLSYMANLNYNYLLQLPLRPRSEHYTCNICGRMFCRQSELNEHIQNCHLGCRRGCCVYRHMLKSQSQPIPDGLFHCEYCGLKFTRAYSCELHQQDCAKRFRRAHDVQTNLMLLR